MNPTTILFALVAILHIVKGLTLDNFIDQLPPDTDSLHIQLAAQTQTEIQTLFNTNIVSATDEQLNAEVIQQEFQRVSEYQAQKKIDLISKALQTKGFTSTSLDLFRASNKTVLPFFLQRLAKLDESQQPFILGTGYRRQFRGIVLLLHAIKVTKLNQLSTRAKFSLNHLSCFDPTETFRFKGYLPKKNETTRRILTNKEKNSQPKLKSRLLINTPAPTASELNWVSAGKVGPVLNQGSCGGCWAFAASAVMQSRLLIAELGRMVTLSEQQLISCAIANGCNGGNYETAWDYSSSNGGVVSSTTYPYTSASYTSTTPICISQNTQSPITTASSQYQNFFTENQIQAALASGPVAIAISTPACFQNYRSGVLTQAECSCYGGASSIDHAVTIVGYGTDSSTGIPYWLVQNSWGVSWGQSGYVMLERGVPYPAMCGLLTDPAIPNTVTLSPDCSAPNPPSFCASIEIVRYSSTNGTTANPSPSCVQNPSGAYYESSCNPQDLSLTSAPTATPSTDLTWAWVILGILIFALLLLFSVCIYIKCRQHQEKGKGNGKKEFEDFPPPQNASFSNNNNEVTRL